MQHAADALGRDQSKSSRTSGGISRNLADDDGLL